ncbi:MAG: spore germination protein GerW family protein [Syntrophales bacterium]|nr:spore germination protein GerW family protein [Syntrophales bacterium]
MSTEAKEIIGKLMEELRSIAKTETILGEKVQVGEFTLIPVSKVSLGLGAGASQGSESKKAGEGGAGGGGVMVTPIAFIVIKGEEISFHGIKRGGTLDTFFEALPEMAEKIMVKSRETEVKEEKG